MEVVSDINPPWNTASTCFSGGSLVVTLSMMPQMLVKNSSTLLICPYHLVNGLMTNKDSFFFQTNNNLLWTPLCLNFFFDLLHQIRLHLLCRLAGTGATLSSFSVSLVETISSLAAIAFYFSTDCWWMKSNLFCYGTYWTSSCSQCTNLASLISCYMMIASGYDNLLGFDTLKITNIM